MKYPIFTQRIDKLFTAFDKKKNDNQIMLLFDKVKDWSEYKLSIVVNKIIDNENTFPSFSKFMSVGNTVYEESLIKKTGCSKCQSDGFVLDYQEGYRVLFRCDACENWKYRLSEKIPVWSNGYVSKSVSEELKVKGQEVDVI